MRSLLLMAIAFVLLACGQTRLVKDGITQEQFEADKSDCKQKVLTMYRGSDRVAFGDAPNYGERHDEMYDIEGIPRSETVVRLLFGGPRQAPFRKAM